MKRIGSLMCCCTFLAAGCGGQTVAGSTAAVPPAALRAPSLPAALPTEPIVVTFDTQNGSLAYWPMRRGGGMKLQSLSGSLHIANVYGMAANGDVIIMANYNPAELVTYDLKAQKENTLADPYGGPLDVAVGKDGTYYAMSLGNVAVFKPGSSKPAELSCSFISDSQAVAVDNEGDVFVNGYGPASFMGVIEYPAGSSSCMKLHLRAELGYAAGIGIDPKTDDLIVVDDPGLCAGGILGRAIIYPKPYKQRTSVRRVLGATYCAGGLRLDAGSEHILYGDATVSAGFPLIDQSRYPSAKSEGIYQNGYYSNGNFSGFTTIPNTLPN